MAKLSIKNKYGIIPNKLLNNPEITLKAKGLFGYLQSKPENWDFSADRIKFDTKESRDAIQSGLRELEKFGYLERCKFQNDKGFWEIEYILDDNPTQEKPKQENPVQENPATNKKRNTNKEIIKKENILNKPKNEIFRAGAFETKMIKFFIEKHLENSDPKFLYLYNKNGEEKLIKDWAPEIDKLKRIDGYSEKQIEFIFNYLFKNDFWTKNIISISKFRKKDKNGIPFFTVLIGEAKNSIQAPKVVNSIGVL